MYKLIVSDVDGTFTNNERELSHRTKEVITEAHNRGFLIVLASGRTVRDLHSFVNGNELEDVIDALIGMNGSELLDLKSGELHILNRNKKTGFIKLFSFLPDAKTSKLDALKRYCSMVNVDLADVIAFGDSPNDEAMLKEAGLGVCMKNGYKTTKEVADVVLSETNYEDGLANYLKWHVFNET